MLFLLLRTVSHMLALGSQDRGWAMGGGSSQDVSVFGCYGTGVLEHGS